MSDVSIENWQELLKVYRKSCGDPSSHGITDNKFDKASISEDLHVIINSCYINIKEVEGIYLEDDRAIFKLPSKKYVEVKEGPKNLEVSVYHEVEITEVEFERDHITVTPKSVTFKDNKNRAFNLDLSTCQYKDNISYFIKL